MTDQPTNIMNPKRIEEVSLNSWPALEQILYDGWILRFSNGYTKRANSVNPLYLSTLDVQQKIATCEALYRERGLRPLFRLTPFSSPSEIDQALEQRDYKVIDETFVLSRELTSSFGGGQAQGPLHWPALRFERLNNWFAIYCQLRQLRIDSTAQQTHLAILQKIPAKRLPMVLVDGETVVCCAMGVQEGQYVGFFNMFTALEHRNKGYGMQLVSGMLHHAQENGATYAYLQVMKENAPARRLYAKVGFKKVYHYWYRVPQS
jgi:GNAT superfamily N-acetyltransferase